MPKRENQDSRARRVARPVAAAGVTLSAAMFAAGAAAPSAAGEQPVPHARQPGVTGPAIQRLAGRWVRNTTSLSTSGSASHSTVTYSIPESIVLCESGGNWRAVNPSTGAGGAYQILPSTWTAYGGTGLPQDASPAQQSTIAAKIYASEGRGAWSC